MDKKAPNINHLKDLGLICHTCCAAARLHTDFSLETLYHIELIIIVLQILVSTTCFNEVNKSKCKIKRFKRK